MKNIRTVHVVYANWCPHCVPTTVEPVKRAAEQLGIKCRLYDIDTEDEKAADELVREHGDWSPDYLVPQVFLEFEDGEIKHALTGYPEGVAYTKRAVENLLQSEVFQAQSVQRRGK